MDEPRWGMELNSILIILVLNLFLFCFLLSFSRRVDKSDHVPETGGL